MNTHRGWNKWWTLSGSTFEGSRTYKGIHVVKESFKCWSEGKDASGPFLNVSTVCCYAVGIYVWELAIFYQVNHVRFPTLVLLLFVLHFYIHKYIHSDGRFKERLRYINVIYHCPARLIFVIFYCFNIINLWASHHGCLKHDNLERSSAGNCALAHFCCSMRSFHALCIPNSRPSTVSRQQITLTHYCRKGTFAPLFNW